MKLLIASDIHGSAEYCRQLLEAYKREGAEKLILLGDVHKDGIINAKDILKLRKHFANPSANPLTDYEKQVGNVHNDDTINAKDILKLRKHFANPSANPLS